MYRAQELCDSRGGRPGLHVPNNRYGLCWREATLNLNCCPLCVCSGDLTAWVVYILYLITIYELITHCEFSVPSHRGWCVVRRSAQGDRRLWTLTRLIQVIVIFLCRTWKLCWREQFQRDRPVVWCLDWLSNSPLCPTWEASCLRTSD